jgi:hypothetical protein
MVYLRGEHLFSSVHRRLEFATLSETGGASWFSRFARERSRRHDATIGHDET